MKKAKPKTPHGLMTKVFKDLATEELESLPSKEKYISVKKLQAWCDDDETTLTPKGSLNIKIKGNVLSAYELLEYAKENSEEI